mgnify:CR=1 FL=1
MMNMRRNRPKYPNFNFGAMKSHQRFIVLLLITGLTVLSGCELSDKPDVPMHEGQRELRAAIGEFRDHFNGMMGTPALSALNILGEVFLVNPSPFSNNGQTSDAPDIMRQLAALNHLLSHPYEIPLPGNRVILEVVRSSVAESVYLPVPGVYQYNFSSGRFDLLNPYVDHFEFRFPSCTKNRKEENRDAVLRFESLSTIKMDKSYGSNGDVPSSVDARMMIDGEEVLEVSYRVRLDETGKPVATAIQLDAPPYSMNLNYSGKNETFSLVATVKEEEKVLMSLNLGVNFCPTRGKVANANGLILMTPLKIEGVIQPLDALGSIQDVDEMNRHLDVQVRHLSGNKLIGNIAFRMKHNPRLNTELPELAIVYRDGSHEFLTDLLEETFPQ